MKSIIVNGRPTKNIEVKTVTKRDGTQDQVAAFTVAQQYGSGNNSGVQFIDVEIWGEDANLFDGVTTRHIVEVEAAGLNAKAWTDRNGNARVNQKIAGLRKATVKEWNGSTYAPKFVYNAPRRAETNHATRATAPAAPTAAARPGTRWVELPVGSHVQRNPNRNK